MHFRRWLCYLSCWQFKEPCDVAKVIAAFERVSEMKLNYKIAPRRSGDVVAAYANTEKANTILGWEAKSTLDDAMLSAWKWEQKIRND